MKIEHIRTLSAIDFDIQENCLWFVATQTHPEFWCNPDRDFQWYIDANWLIKTDTGLTYDPR